MEKDPRFVSKSLDNPEEPAKVIKPRRKVTRKKIAPVKRVSKKERQINSQLTSIYSDANGRIPSMDRIIIKRNHPLVKIFFFLLVVGGALAAAAWSGLLVLPEKKFAEEKVSLVVRGPMAAALGATTTYTIAYKNDQNATLNNAVLSTQFPKDFVYLSSEPTARNSGNSEWQLGSVGPGEGRQITITGLLYGRPGGEQSWRVFLTYRPQNMNSDLQKIAIYNVAVEEAGVSLAIAGPAKAVLGNKAEYTFRATAADKWPAGKLELQPILPDNFYLVSSSPALDKNKIWTIKNTPATSTIVYKIAGKFSTSSENAAVIKGTLSLAAKETGRLFELASAGADTQLEDNDISLNLAVNGSTGNMNASPGELLNMSLFLKNMTRLEMKNAAIKLAIDAPSYKKQSVLNWTEITDELDGVISGAQLGDNVRRGEITWDKAKLPALAKLKPNDSASIDVRLPIKDSQAFALAELKTFEIKIAAELTYTDNNNKTQVLATAPIVIRLNSDLKLEVRDTITSGDAAKEEHKAVWVLTNNFHPVKNINISADIYGLIDWFGGNTSTVPAGQLTYDPKAQKITWTVNEMPLSVDTLALPFTFTLKQKNTTQKVLVSKAHVQAVDATTGEALDFMGDAIGLNP
ncbi:DUF11 domain-containing protein [Patescibacteria group bacterium]|nr:MAG: DUF11 domain-containing protein [Patescibacteria group bacterium]